MRFRFSQNTHIGWRNSMTALRAGGQETKQWRTSTRESGVGPVHVPERSPEHSVKNSDELGRR